MKWMNAVIVRIHNYHARKPQPFSPILQMRKQRLLKDTWFLSEGYHRIRVQNLAHACPNPLRESDHKTARAVSLSSRTGLLLSWLVIYLQIPACRIDSEFMMHTQIFCDLCFWNFIRPTCNYCGKCLHIYKLLFRHEGQGQPLSFKVLGIDTRDFPADKGAQIWLIMGCVSVILTTLFLAVNFEAPNGSSFLSMKIITLLPIVLEVIPF